MNKPQNSSKPLRFATLPSVVTMFRVNISGNSVTAIRKKQEKSFDNKNAGKKLTYLKT